MTRSLHLYAVICHLTLIGVLKASGVEANDCIGDGLFANYSTGCQEYYKCSNNKVVSTYSCFPGFKFQPAFKGCMFGPDLPCVQHICDPQETFSYATPGTRCSFYYKCNKGIPEEKTCIPGTWFDIKKQNCTTTSGVCYEPVCTGQRDGRHVDSTQGCRRSIICSGGNLVAVDSSQRESDLKHCPSPRSTSVAFPKTGLVRCSYLPDGRHPSSSIRCGGYVTCKNGETESYVRCPESHLFDGVDCSHTENTQCIDGCTGKKNGFYADPSSGCKEYFHCNNGTGLLVAVCPDGEVFNGHKCVPSNSYNCPIPYERPVCVKKSDGFYRDFSDCSSYYYCSNEEVVLHEKCPQNEVWDGKHCVKSSNFYCEGPTLWEGCAEKPSGYYQDRGSDSYCKKYYHCHRGMKMSFTCNSGYIYDGEECVKEETYMCPSLEKDTCDFKADGVYPHSSDDCRSYYMCIKGFKSTYLCEPSQIFNGEKCVDANTFACPYKSTDCKGKSNGYHSDTNYNCRKYFYCENGKKLTTLQCAGSKIFNGQSCVSQKDYECPVGPEGDPCTLKSDGYYVYGGSKCRKYYKCVNYKLTSEHFCPVGQVFDGLESCAAKNCSSQTVMCEKDGFFLDLSSRCKSYHICTDKRITTLQCGDNKVFNGQICVPEDSFPCPDECSVNHCNNFI